MTKQRKADILEKVILALVVSLLVCMGVHQGPAILHGLATIIPGGCTTVPAFTAHVEFGVADVPENLPRKDPAPAARASSSSKATTNTPVTPTK